MAMPDRSPLLAPTLACGSCGSLMKPKVVMGPRNTSHVHYECRHVKHDPYIIESTAMIQGEMQPAGPDGKAVIV
jgi:hypothetical protein